MAVCDSLARTPSAIFTVRSAVVVSKEFRGLEMTSLLRNLGFVGSPKLPNSSEELGAGGLIVDVRTPSRRIKGGKT
jgi:hypothetical protein